MTTTFPWRVYDSTGRHLAACKQAEYAACIVANLPLGGAIKYRIREIRWVATIMGTMLMPRRREFTVWQEGPDGATESFQEVGYLARLRVKQWRAMHRLAAFPTQLDAGEMRRVEDRPPETE